MTVLADAGRVAVEVLGEGLPVTVLVHGLGGSTAETRPLARRLGGTRVLLDLRGHGASGPLPPSGWDYDVLADDLRTVADAHGATGALGLSLGAGALLRVLAAEPDRFDRLALVLPAALDAARADGATARLGGLGDAIDRGDVDAVTAILLAEVPEEVRVRRGVAALVQRRAAQLASRPAPRPSGDDRPLQDRAVLRGVTAPTLVVGQADDPLHPLALARDVAALLPSGRLLALPAGGVYWTRGREVQQALADHLTPSEDS